MATPHAAQQKKGVMRDTNPPLTLKVMRLSKPKFQPRPDVLVEPEEEPTHSVLAKQLQPKQDPSSQLDAENAFGLSDLIFLPRSFGMIYVGQPFCCYLSLLNHSDQDVSNVSMKVDLQTRQQERKNLLDLSHHPISAFPPGQSADFVVRRELTEATDHYLVCTTSYLEGAERRSFKKLFKFSVSEPFEIEHKVLPFIQGESLLVEIQIKNMVQNPVVLSSVAFLPASKKAKMTDLNTMSSLSSTPKVLCVGGIRNYLYKIESRKTRKKRRDSSVGEGAEVREEGDSDSTIDEKELAVEESPIFASPTAKSSSAQDTQHLLGTFHIHWRTTMGESAVKLHQVYYLPPKRRSVNLEFVSLPSEIVLEQTFTALCKLTNQTNRTIEPVLKLAKSEATGIITTAISGMVSILQMSCWVVATCYSDT
ncbi:Trafficking protein particle complex subunit 13, variant 2 [Balamuthia mandrillaris]